MAAETTVPPAVLARLLEDQRVWLTTLRARDGSPHVTPMWFIYGSDRWWLSAPANSVKVGNLRADPRVVLALEDGVTPVVAEGTAILHTIDLPEVIVQCFADKYAGWDIRSDAEGSASRVLIEVATTRWLLVG